MWRLAILVLASSVSAERPNITVDGEIFGPSRTLTCTWFTNFENSRFDQCEDATGKLLHDGDSASINCVRPICAQLHEAARKAVGWTKPDAPWGTFTVVLVGRISLNPHEKRYIGDGTRTVLIERLKSVRPLNSPSLID